MFVTECWYMFVSRQRLIEAMASSAIISSPELPVRWLQLPEAGPSHRRVTLSRTLLEWGRLINAAALALRRGAR